MDIRWIVEHEWDCPAMRRVRHDIWGSPWCVRETIHRARDGSKRGKGTAWIRIMCKDILCDGEMLVREESVLAQLPNFPEELADER